MFSLVFCTVLNLDKIETIDYAKKEYDIVAQTSKIDCLEAIYESSETSTRRTMVEEYQRKDFLLVQIP